jgi:solute carrier family 35 protein C2
MVLVHNIQAMCKSSVPVFVLLFAFLFKLEKPTKSLALIISVISFGVCLMVMKGEDNSYEIIGYVQEIGALSMQLNPFCRIVQVLTASSLSGLRWAITQILLDKNSKIFAKSHPVVMNFFLTPVMCATLFLSGCIAEGLGEFAKLGNRFNVFELILKFSIGGLLAFCMTIAEFKLIGETSVVALSVAGICKEVLTIIVSMLVFGDKLSATNVVGLLISLVGIAMFNLYRMRRNSKEYHSRSGTDSTYGFAAIEDDDVEDD